VRFGYRYFVRYSVNFLSQSVSVILILSGIPLLRYRPPAATTPIPLRTGCTNKVLHSTGS